MPHTNLSCNDEVKFKRVQMHIELYELNLKSPMCRCIKLWDTLKTELQMAKTKVKFKLLIKPMCRPTWLTDDCRNITDFSYSNTHSSYITYSYSVISI